MLRMAFKTELSGVAGEIQILPFGTTDTVKETFTLDAAGMDAVIAEFDSRQNDMVIDYEHQTLSGQEAPAAGWIKKLVDKGNDGLWAIVEWTERAKNYLSGREYRYLSPVFYTSAGKVVSLINAALTNQPAIDGMAPIVNKDSGQPGITSRKEDVIMDRAKLCEALGLAADATDEQILEAISALRSAAGVVASKEVLDALGLKEDAAASEVTGTVMALKQSHGQAGDLGKEVAALKARLARKNAEELVAVAMKEVKVTPAQKEWAMKYAETDPEGFKVFAAKASKVIETGEIAGGGSRMGGGATGEMQMLINKSLGITEESFKQFGPKE